MCVLLQLRSGWAKRGGRRNFDTDARARAVKSTKLDVTVTCTTSKWPGPMWYAPHYITMDILLHFYLACPSDNVQHDLSPR